MNYGTSDNTKPLPLVPSLNKLHQLRTFVGAIMTVTPWNRMQYGRVWVVALGLMLACAVPGPSVAGADRPSVPLNILLFTADDLRCESLGCFGGKVPDLTPNLDRFATEGLRFEHAHVNVAICQPSRGVLATGRYGHNSGILGFMHTKRNIPTIMETLGRLGYRTGILGKVNHSTPKQDYQWDFVHDFKQLGNGRSPQRYYAYCREFFAQCRETGQPFYFMVNSHDPHRPFHVPGTKYGDAEEPSRIYDPSQVEVPGFVPDLPGVRRELSYYQNSTRRCDDTFGRVMQALDQSGFRDHTLVVFLSDNGIAIPFAKCNAYLASTRTPWIVRWPGVVKPNRVDRRHFISGIDFFPTVLEALGQPIPDGLDGSSMLALLEGATQPWRDKVFTQLDMKAGGDAVPMRCVQDQHYGYIYNAWSDGRHRYRNNNEGLTMKAMNEAAATNEAIAARVHLFRYRQPVELYDLANDPNCLHNLIDSPEHEAVAQRYRESLLRWMVRTGDPLLPAFQNRSKREIVDATMASIYTPLQQATRKKAKRRGPKRPRRNRQSKAR